MAIRGYNESQLSNSEIFTGLKELADSDQTVKAVNLIKTAKHLSNEDIEAAYIQLKQYPNSLSRASIKAFDEARTILVYNEVPSLSVSQGVPFMTFQYGKDKGYHTYIFMDKYINKSREGILTIQTPVLRDLLESALIANSIKRDYSRLSSNEFLERLLMELYGKFVFRILNREFSIAADKIVSDTLYYWINKFFLTRIFGSNNSPENIEIIASRHFKYIDELKANDIKALYQEVDPIKFSDLLELLKRASSRMKPLSLGTFMSNWINYYFAPALLAIDNIEYLIFMVICLLGGNNIISIAASEMVKETKNIKNFREELLKLIS